MEGSPPFNFTQTPEEVAKLYANEGRRPPFRHHARRYPNGLKEYVPVANLYLFQVLFWSIVYSNMIGCVLS